MDEDIDLTKLAALRRGKLDDLDEEIEALQAKRAKLAREVKAIEKCAAMLGGDAPPRKVRAPKAASAGPNAHDLIIAALPATIGELADALDKPRAVIARSVGQLAKIGRVKRDGDAVRLAKSVREAR